MDEATGFDDAVQGITDAQCTLENLGNIAQLLSDSLSEARHSTVADGLTQLAKVAGDQLERAINTVRSLERRSEVSHG